MKHMGVIEVPEDRWPDTSRMTIAPSRVSVVHGMSGAGYLVQMFREPNSIIRLTVCSTDATLSRSGAVRFADGIPWDDLQEIKRLMGYGDQDAVEVYPPTQDVVNRANMRHLWILPEPLPFAWRSR